jgi:folylpolyglutamate synthase/dihydropteroate synthase
VDWAVVETGMGGRLDATNLLAPEVSIITNISLEHKGYLGNTVAAITYEKAGIIKPATPVVTGVTQPSAIAVVEKKAQTLKAPAFAWDAISAAAACPPAASITRAWTTTGNISPPTCWGATRWATPAWPWRPPKS